MSQTKEQVRERYASAAKNLQNKNSCGCSCGSCCSGSNAEALDCDLTSGSYISGDTPKGLEDLVQTSLGCGNPVAAAELSPGEVILDLGSGAGLDVLLSAKRVAPQGKAYGLDMTDEMLALARTNQEKAGILNAEFLKGDIENIPLPEGHVDVVISNCVINLSTDKDRALQEAIRVLKPGGRLAIMDLIFTEDKTTIDPKIVSNLEQQIGCIIGALDVSDFKAKLTKVGFADVSVEIVHKYSTEMLTDSTCCGSLKIDKDTLPVASAFIRARKPKVS